MVKTNGRKKKSKQVMNRSIMTHGLPPIKATITIRHPYRFKFIAAGKYNITYADLGSVVVFAKTATTSSLLWTRVKIGGVRMIGIAAPNTLKFTYNGVTAGISGDDVMHTDSSVGSTYIATLPQKWGGFVKPNPRLQCSQWQSCLQTNTAIAFTIESDQIGAFVDVMLTHECPTDNTTNNNAGPAISGGTLGDLLYVGLDGINASSSNVGVVGPDNLG
jgi:hypothetical protein